MPSNDIQQIEPPALPQAAGDYNPSYMSQLLNVLRLYFNRVAQTTNSILSSSSGGAALFKPHATFYSSTDQTAAIINTGYDVAFENTRSSLGITIDGVSNTDITFEYKGVYTLAVTLHMEQSSGTGDVTVWFKKNGVDVADSAQRIGFRNSRSDQVNYVSTLEVVAGDVLTFEWGVTNTNLFIQAYTAASPYPAIPSATVAISYASNINS